MDYFRASNVRIYGMKELVDAVCRNGDTISTHIENPESLNTADFSLSIGDQDLDTIAALSGIKKYKYSGSVHWPCLSFINMYVEIEAPYYWWDDVTRLCEKFGSQLKVIGSGRYTVCISYNDLRSLFSASYTLQYSHDPAWVQFREWVSTLPYYDELLSMDNKQ